MIYQLLFPKGRKLALDSDLRTQVVDLLTEGRRFMKRFPVGMHAFSTLGIVPGWHDALLNVKEDGTGVAYILMVNAPQVAAVKLHGVQMKTASLPRGIIRLPEDEQVILNVYEVAPGEPRLFSVILYLPFDALQSSGEEQTVS